MASAREILQGLEQFGIRLGLEHLRELAAALGHPERATPAVIVAGTNGKGSVSALLASIAEAAGVRTGLYTSPHLERVEERIRVGGREIDATALGDLLQEVLAAAARLGHASPTYFEAMTLGALLHFARQKVDLSVLEVGMGGRLDATNLADGRLAVVTAIALDHQEFLGSTLDAIAREKAVALGCQNAELTVAAAENSPGLDGSYDAVLAFNLLHLILDRPSTLARIHRLLKPGGLFISKTPCLSEMNPLIRVAVPLMRFVGKAPFVSFFAAPALEAEIACAGFIIDERERHGTGRKDARIFIVARKPG